MHKSLCKIIDLNVIHVSFHVLHEYEEAVIRIFMKCYSYTGKVIKLEIFWW